MERLKTKVVYLEEVSVEKVTEIIKLYDEEECKIKIILNSHGGSYDAANLLLKTINENSWRFEIVAVQQILSAAFTLFFEASCKKEIIKGCIGMWHQVKMTASILQNGKMKDKETLTSLKHFEEVKGEDDQFMLKLGFTEQEISDYHNGEDVWFTSSRMTEFLK